MAESNEKYRATIKPHLKLLDKWSRPKTAFFLSFVWEKGSSESKLCCQIYNFRGSLISTDSISNQQGIVWILIELGVFVVPIPYNKIKLLVTGLGLGIKQI